MNATSISTSPSVDNVLFVQFVQSPSHRPANAQSVQVEAPRRAVRRRLPRELAESDDTLVERMAVGDDVARGALKDRYAAFLHDAAATILDDAEEAQSVVACVFEGASAGWPPERGRVKRWLARLVRRAARARRRVRDGLEE